MFNDNSQEFKLFVWGPADAGKTSFISAMLGEVINHKEWTVNTFDEIKVGQLLARYRHGELPQATDFVAEHNITLEEAEPSLFLGPKKIRLTISDIPGNLIGNREVADPEERNKFEESLEAGRIGVIAIIDPEQKGKKGIGFGGSNEDYASTISQLIHHLRIGGTSGFPRRKKIDASIVFCITKIDMDRHYKHIHQPEEYLKDIIGERTFSRIEKSFHSNRWRVFPVSVVGRYTPTSTSDIDRPNIIHYKFESAQRQYRVANLEARKPINVKEVALWIFRSIGAM